MVSSSPMMTERHGLGRRHELTGAGRMHELSMVAPWAMPPA